MKTKRVLFGMFLILSLLMLPILATGVQTANATNAALLYAPNFWANGTDYGDELTYTSSCLNTIMNLFTQYGNYGWRYNCQNSAAVKSNYISTITSAENNYDKVAVFTKGHIMNFGSPSFQHYALRDNTGALTSSGWVEDCYSIYPNTKGKTTFAWIWHCGTAMQYPSSQDTLGWKGMPYAWTRNNAMALNGYSSNSGTQVYIGFQNYSPQFRDPTWRSGRDYGYFCVRVFTYLLQYKYSVSTSLDKASQDAFGVTNFSQTPLYYGENRGGGSNPVLFSWMQIYGNGQGLGVPN